SVECPMVQSWWFTIASALVVEARHRFRTDTALLGRPVVAAASPSGYRHRRMRLAQGRQVSERVCINRAWAERWTVRALSDSVPGPLPRRTRSSHAIDSFRSQPPDRLAPRRGADRDRAADHRLQQRF